MQSTYRIDIHIGLIQFKSVLKNKLNIVRKNIFYLQKILSNSMKLKI